MRRMNKQCLPARLTIRDRETLEALALEYDYVTAEGMAVQVFSDPKSYEGWRMIVGGNLGHACKVVRFRDGGTTRVASELGELYVPVGNKQATFHQRSRTYGHLLLCGVLVHLAKAQIAPEPEGTHEP